MPRRPGSVGISDAVPLRNKERKRDLRCVAAACGRELGDKQSIPVVDHRDGTTAPRQRDLYPKIIQNGNTYVLKYLGR